MSKQLNKLERLIRKLNLRLCSARLQDDGFELYLNSPGAWRKLDYMEAVSKIIEHKRAVENGPE